MTKHPHSEVNTHSFTRQEVVESTIRQVSGLTFGEAMAIREAARNTYGAGENEGGGGQMGSSTKSRYGARLRLLEAGLWASSVALAVMQAVVFAALWVIQTVGPRVLRLADWTGDAVAETDLVMEGTTPPPRAREADESAATRPTADRPEPTVVDGTVIRVRFDDRERMR